MSDEEMDLEIEGKKMQKDLKEKIGRIQHEGVPETYIAIGSGKGKGMVELAVVSRLQVVEGDVFKAPVYPPIVSFHVPQNSDGFGSAVIEQYEIRNENAEGDIIDLRRELITAFAEGGIDDLVDTFKMLDIPRRRAEYSFIDFQNMGES